MIEKAKTYFLVFLVAASLLQSYVLIGNVRDFEIASPQTEYVEAELTGTQLELQDLVYPTQMVLHFGDAKHTVLNPNTVFYEIILEKLQQRNFDSFARLSEQSFTWNELRDSYQGVEIRYKDGISIEILQRQMLLKGEEAAAMEPINRIWMLNRPGQETVRTLFISDSTGTVYEAKKVDLTPKDVEGFVGLGTYLTKYGTEDGVTYLAEEPLPMVGFRYAYEEMTQEQLQQSLFADPATTRSLMERDGSLIITDGKRGLQMKPGQKWMAFTDPAASYEQNSTIRENMLASVQFVNQHGGWNGKYIAYRLPQRAAIGAQVFVFRQYAGTYPGAFPIISERSEFFGYIRVTVQNGVVTDYERSLIRLKDELEKSEHMLPGGEELREMVQRYRNRNTIVTVFPAYRPIVTEDYVELRPGWAVELFNGTYDFLS
ncbi:YycH family regulatory protein [Paenibacillus turpanensis]|uniref:YycH family regulatory protein n=1 Tax=Paenibacillus turpanensis TaxID=2689078 RepID=UPI001409834B|nr:two-component system activity regulator YycH [Paenibacillus turpanensis]